MRMSSRLEAGYRNNSPLRKIYYLPERGEALLTCTFFSELMDVRHVRLMRRASRTFDLNTSREHVPVEICV
jgi:hypothetical protein